MNICVEFSKKDLVKSLGCRWQNENKRWVCPMYNSDDNFEKLIKLQDLGELGFTKGLKIHSNTVDFKNTSSVYIRVNTGGPTYAYEVCFTREQIYEKLNEYKNNKKKFVKLPKVEDEFTDDDLTDLTLGSESVKLTTEQLLELKINKLKIERRNKVDELRQQQIEELEKLEEYYEDEIRHLNNCKFRDYDSEIRSFN